MERRMQQKKKHDHVFKNNGSSQNINYYDKNNLSLVNNANQYNTNVLKNSQIESYSLPPSMDRQNPYQGGKRILANKLRNNYDKVDPSEYGYYKPETNTNKTSTYATYETRIKPPVISTHNDKAIINKPTWWG